MELNVDYYGHDIKKIEDQRVDSAAACQSLCQATSGCIYWTWVSQTEHCYLKDLHALLGRVQSQQTVGMVSGPKYCTPTPPGCHEWDVDYQGFDIKKIEGQCSSAKHCQHMCQGTAGCSFWSYVSSSKSCYLKSNLALNGRHADESTLGMVSGPAFCPLHPVCKEDNVDYSGYDVQKIESGDVASAKECQALCEKLPECSFWTWVSYKQNCYLKNYFALIGRDAGPAASGMISGPKRCAAVPQACHEYNVDYRGHDVKKLESGQVFSADSCRALCQADQSCHYWTWVRSTNSCYLKDQYAPLGRVQDSSTFGMVSGSRRCGEQFSGSCYEVGVDYYGYDIEKLETGEVTTPSACQALCKNRAGCYYWTWVQTTQSCYLKNPYALQGWMRDSTTMDKISGAKDCVPVPATCHELDVDYRGFDIQKIETNSVASYADCQQLCEANVQCFYWTWVSQKKNCYLKNQGALLGRTQDAATAGLVSGPKTCTPRGQCYEVDVDYHGFDTEKIETGQVTSAALCHYHCVTAAHCAYWTWVGQTSNCYLKSSNALLGRVQDFSSVGMVSGPRICAPSAGSLEINVDFVGNDIKLVDDGSVKSYPDCQYLCQQYSDCHYWTYYQDKMSCFLKNAMAPTSRLPRQSTVSGPKFFDGPGVPPPSLPEEPLQPCFQTNVEFIGVELQSLVTNFAAQCQSACQANALCSFFTFYRLERRCVLKSSETGRPQRELPVGFAISGMKFCSSNDNHDSGPQCAVYNTEYVGQECGSHATASSALHCQALCQQSSVCNFFTYHSQDGRCVLQQFASSSAEIQAVPRGFAVSATKYCEAPETDAPSCAERDAEYLGNTLRTVTTTSATDCQGLCKENLHCDFFTFDGLTSACILKKAYEGGEDKLYKLPKPFATSATKECAPSESHPECAENNTLYLGIDTAPVITAETSSECQKLCQQFTDCEYFTFSTSEKRCRLRKLENAGSTVQKLPFPGIVSGPKYCSTPMEPSGGHYAEVDVELKNYNLPASPVAAENATACLEACNGEPECHYWTYYSTVDESMACHLKGAGALEGKASLAGAVSGSKDVVITVEVGIEYVDANLPKDPLRAQSLRECQEACANVLQCKYWTFYPRRSVNCYLKDFTAANTKKTNVNAVSGGKYSIRGMVPRKYLDDRRYGADLLSGQTVASAALTAASANECQKQAQANPKKPFWSWNKFDQTCNLHGDEVLGSETYDYEWVSGYAESQDSSYPSEAYTYGKGIDLLLLGTFQMTTASSPEACAEMCAGVELCRVASFTRAASDGTPNCFLGRLGAQRAVVSKDQVVVAQHNLVLQVGRKPTTVSISDQSGSTLTKCMKLCGQTETCKRWSIDLSTGVCSLYAHTDAWTDNASCVTADIGILLEEIEEAVLVDTALLPVAVNKVVKPVTDCAVQFQKSHCLAYSYAVAGAGARDGACYFGSIGDGADLPRFTKRQKGSVLVRRQNRLVMTEVAFVGERSTSTTEQLDTAVACATACSTAMDCKAWTFRGDESRCELFASISTGVADSPLVVSGTKQADGSAFEASHVKLQTAIATRLTDTILARQTVQSETECETLCTNTANCVQWSTTTQDDDTLECVAGAWNALLEPNNNARTSVISSRFFRPFMELKGKPIKTDNPASPPADPVQHCAEQCESHVADCHAWTMKITATGAQCEYFTETVGVASTTNPLAVSGSKGISDVQARAVVYGAYQVPATQELSAPTVLDCQKKCEDDDSCLAWSYKYTETIDVCRTIQDPAYDRTAEAGAIVVELHYRFLQPFQVLAGEQEDIIDTVEGSATKNDLCGCMAACFDRIECAAWALELTEAGSICTLYSAFKKVEAPGLVMSGTRRNATSCESGIADRLLLENPIMFETEGTLDEVLKTATSQHSYTVGISLVTPAQEPPQYKQAKVVTSNEVSDSAVAVVVNYVAP
ncbi:PAN domain-containing protein [Toxoplasma gondii]|uniref:PAN domain-containing protein n=1 Tax=Toxoplasma gondii TaxID=5811 RepID=A0A7J6JZG3_TOXGO|nr:PAN domain-containing protein [Toxoplasma gondii]